MKLRSIFFLALGGFWASVADTQWQQVSSPADRMFTFIQIGTGIFAGSENSGLWKSTNESANFTIYPTGLPEMNYDVRPFDLNNDTL